MAFNLKENTGVLIKKAARLFERVANLNLDELGVTYAQTIFLVRLGEKDGQNQMELAKSSGLRQPTVVRILDRMERDKLIKRIKSKTDRRCSHFYLTERAKKVCTKLEAQGEMMQSIAAKSLDKNAIKQLNDHLGLVIHNLAAFIEVNKC